MSDIAKKTDIEKLFEDVSSSASIPEAARNNPERNKPDTAVPVPEPATAVARKPTSEVKKIAELPKPRKPRAAKAKGETAKLLKLVVADRTAEIDKLQKDLEASNKTVQELRGRFLRLENNLLHCTNLLRAKEVERLTERGRIIEDFNNRKEQWEREAFEKGRFYQFQLDHSATSSADQNRYFFQQRQAKRLRQV